MSGPVEDGAATGVETKAAGALYPVDSPPAYASPRQRERLLRITLQLAVAAAALTALAAFERYRFASEGLRLGTVAPAQEHAVAQHRVIATAVLAVAVLAALALWLRWFSQAYANLLPLGAGWTRLSRRTAVACCAVPVVNLFMAPRLMTETWHVSDPEGERRQYPGDAKRRAPRLVVMWALAGFLTFVAAGLSRKIVPGGLDQLEPVRSGALVEAGVAVLVAVVAFLTAGVAAAVTERQETRAARLEAIA